MVREKIKALEKEIAESSKVEPEATDPNRVILVGPGASNEYTKKGIQEVQVTETKEGIQLTSGGNNTHIATNESFEVPFKIATSVMTNSVDIRIHFGAHGAMVFNSKERPGQLWMHHPETSEKTNANRGTGKLKVDEMHDIEILVRYNEIEILIDGKAKGLFKGNFLDVKGPVGIGPAHMAKVTVKSFYAEPLEE